MIGNTLPEETMSNLAACVESLKLIPMLTVLDSLEVNLEIPGKSCMDIPEAKVLLPILISVRSSLGSKLFKVNCIEVIEAENKCGFLVYLYCTCSWKNIHYIVLLLSDFSNT